MHAAATIALLLLHVVRGSNYQREKGQDYTWVLCISDTSTPESLPHPKISVVLVEHDYMYPPYKQRKFRHLSCSCDFQRVPLGWNEPLLQWVKGISSALQINVSFKELVGFLPTEFCYAQYRSARLKLSILYVFLSFKRNYQVGKIILHLSWFSCLGLCPIFWISGKWKQDSLF